jgi:hypothetical protein
MVPLPLIEECDYCGRCCIGVSINSPQLKKAAGVRCVHLGTDNMCKVWGDVTKQPAVCRTIQPNNSLCRFDLRGAKDEAKKHYRYLIWLDRITTPK